ncbi:MAG: hypothetical protein LBF65_00665 [Holosporales bacterium]|nr:hypothetical protein [Holosporales bacterium]
MSFQPSVMCAAYNSEDCVKAEVIQVAASKKPAKEKNAKKPVKATEVASVTEVDPSEVLASDHRQMLALTIASDLGIMPGFGM